MFHIRVWDCAWLQIGKTHDDQTDADLWKEFAIFNRAYRYLAVSRELPRNMQGVSARWLLFHDPHDSGWFDAGHGHLHRQREGLYSPGLRRDRLDGG